MPNRIARRVSAALLALSWCASQAVADNYPRQPGIDVQHYIFRVTLSDDNDEITGETTVAIKFVTDEIGRAHV